MSILKKILDDYRVTRDFQTEIREGYRIEIEKHLKGIYDTTCNFRYGGSLAKSTANINNCDIDLLTYLDNDSQLSLEKIYNNTYDALIKNYICERKNSAITIKNKHGEKWDYNVDVVPGKFTTNDEDTDVYLWQNKTNSRLKTNPEKQITLIKESKSKDVIRLIKLFRHFNNFKFKSFFLEIFAVNIIEPNYSNDDSIHDKMIKFCSNYSKIGVTKIYDPANSNNDIMKIHTEYEFQIIRDKIKILYEALMTDNDKTIKDCILGNQINIDDAYWSNAIKNSIMESDKFSPIIKSIFSIYGYIVKGDIEQRFYSNTELGKELQLKFVINTPTNMNVSSVEWIITNSGYEAKKAQGLRGKLNESSDSSLPFNQFKRYFKKEKTSYYGNHFVQAIIITKSGYIFYSNVFTVRVR